MKNFEGASLFEKLRASAIFRCYKQIEFHQSVYLLAEELFHSRRLRIQQQDLQIRKHRDHKNNFKNNFKN